MKHLFTGPQDVQDTVGQLRFGANELEDLGAVTGLPDVRATCPLRQDDGSYLVYGMHPFGDHTGGKPWRLFRFRTCDGLNFTERKLVYESPSGNWLGTGSVVHNTNDGSFLAVRWHPHNPGHAMHAFGSPDGTDWRPLSDEPVYIDHDSGKAMFDPRTGEYVVYQATYQQHEKPYPDTCPENVRRVMHIRTSKDGVKWRPTGDAFLKGPYMPQEGLITPDADDPPELEFYDFAAFPYGDRYVGMMQNYAASPLFAYPWSPHGPHLSTEWWISKDGRQWQRPFRDVFAAGPAPWAVSCAPMTLNGKHIWIIRGRAYGLLQDRLFFTGALANAAFTAPPLVIRNAVCPLLLNASLGFHGPDKYPGFKQQRYLTAELLDEEGKIIPGYETHRCTIKDLDAGATRLWWGASSRMKRVEQTVRVRLYLRDARVYSLEAPQ